MNRIETRNASPFSVIWDYARGKDVAEIKQLKREVVGLKENLKDVLRILGVVYGQPYIQPKKTMLPEQSKGYDEALARLRAQYFEFPGKPSSHSH